MIDGLRLVCRSLVKAKAKARPAAQMGNGADNLTPILLEPGQSKAVLSVHCRRLVDESLFASFATVHVISDHPDAA